MTHPVKRLLPRSLQGQMLLAVALALLVAQGIGATLAWRAQAERERNAVVHSLAFKLIGGRAMRGMEGTMMRPPPMRPRMGRLLVVPRSPMRPGEDREAVLEHDLAALLTEQGVEIADLHVFERELDADTLERLAWASPRARRFAEVRQPRGFFVAAARVEGQDQWLVARTLREPRNPHFLRNLLGQTLLIYLVLIGTIALILRRITKPLAALTRRVEAFSGDPALSPEGRVEPQGPSDTRSLIAAHNAMEARIGALLDEKNVMLGAIGHDLKTPLAALRIRIESVEDEAERTRMAATIEDITTTLDDILSLARVGRPTDMQEPTEIGALTASVIEEYEDMGEPVELGDTARVVLPVRATWLRRAIRNLVSNALRYAGGATVTVEKRGNVAVIAVTDDGPGIPEAEIARMMEPFERGDPSRNRGTGGAGIGLTLARAIAEQHGGELVLANRPEGGLRAEIRLDL